MPRKKTIDYNEIRLEKIDINTVEIKSCLGANLIFQEPFTPKQWHTLNSYFKCGTVESENKVTIKTGNSWKGLVMFLLSVAYCRFNMKFPGRLCDVQQHTTTAVSFKYEHLLWGHTGDFSIQTNDIIEQIVAPKSWRPCYVRGDYTVKDIQKSISNLSQLLGIDMKNSTLQTEFSSQLPHQYKSNPAHRVDTSHLLCSALDSYADGIGFVTADTMKSIMNRTRVASDNMTLSPAKRALLALGFRPTTQIEIPVNKAIIVPDEVPPDKIEICLKKAIPISDTIGFFAYEITTQTVQNLCNYFPFLTFQFQYEATQPEVPSFVIFDRTYLGKWG